jgi:molybdopterin/thiamine biosynthesis adenylyltransferase
MKYDRQIAFNKFGKKTQLILSNSKIAIVGVGALGSVCSEMLTRLGIGELILFDHDHVELVNLQRQFLYNESDVSKNKAIVAKKKLEEINSDVLIKSYNKKIDLANVDLLKKVDLVIDCSDNIPTRLLINDYCWKNNINYIHCAAIQDLAVVIPFNFKYGNKKKMPCLHCIYNENTPSKKCIDYGIINPATVTCSSITTMIAIKILSKEKIECEMIRYKAWNLELNKISIVKKENCVICSNK